MRLYSLSGRWRRPPEYDTNPAARAGAFRGDGNTHTALVFASGSYGIS